ncbi:MULTISPECIES: hypothetical protein [Oceanobacillus]|uniref:hypothetical protein n=1 Tax=Oceanobacillus TaxID=182709 RepID=UPI001867BCAD|nr:hypothetical protein [Oceanobacillus oncorhynchi]UUI41668.1 hypothetical protein NP440_09180 [Oceanobacillus oncorhynchi]
MEIKKKGWFLTGLDPLSYEMGIDYEIVLEGKASGYLKSKTEVDSTSFATMMQMFKANRYKGKRVRLSSYICTKGVKNSAGMWMGVKDTMEELVQLDNMSNRPVKGSTDWKLYSIVLDVPNNSTTILFGIILSGKGTVWANQFFLEEVNENIPTTNMQQQDEMLNSPVNLSFDKDSNH